MTTNRKPLIFKILKITVIAIGSLLLLMYLLPILFPGKIGQEVRGLANKRLKGELNFSKANLYFFKHFPSLTLTVEDFSLKGSAPFAKQNLVSSQEVAFGINIKSLIFGGEVKIDEIFISKAKIDVRINEKGEANYNVYVSESKKEKKDESEASLRLDKIVIQDSRFVYDDKSSDILITAQGFDYIGKGDLHEAIFDLKTKASITSFDLVFEGEEYLKNKKVDAELITRINTNSLEFVFQQNNLILNKLPIDFNGKLNILKSGYDIDLSVKSQNSQLHDFFTALPPQYIKWLEQAEISGKTDFLLVLKGVSDVSKNQNPDLMFNMKVRDGFVSYKKANVPASSIYLNFDTKIPALNTDKMYVKVDSLFFNVGKDYFSGIAVVNGLETPDINAKIKSQLDLGKLNRAIGLQNMSFKGILKADIKANGKFDQNARLFPVTKGDLVWQNGAIKTEYYPNPIDNINLSASVLNTTGQYKDLKIAVRPGSFNFEGKPIFIDADLQNFDDIAYDIKAKGELDVGRIYKVFSRKDLDVQGYVKADVSLKGTQSDAVHGNYNRLNNKGTLVLRDIRTKSDYLPLPFVIKEGLFTFNQNDMYFKDFRAVYGQSDFRMNGKMQNVINFVMSDKAVLKGEFSVDSDYINVDEFMTSVPVDSVSVATSDENLPEQEKKGTGVVVIPPNYDFDLKARAQKVNFQGLNIDKLNGGVAMKDGTIKMKDARFTLIGSPFAMNATYNALSSQKAAFDYSIKAEDFDVKKAYNEIKMFREMASAAESAEGIVSLDYTIGGHLDGNMDPIYPSLKGGGVLSVRDVKMKGYKLFNTVGKKTNHDEMKDPKLSNIDIKTTVKNNIMTIERFKFKVSGFRPRIEGQVSLDGKLNLKMRLGLPPFGIIGIPITITGTQENPKIKIGKQTEDLEEKEYDSTVSGTGVAQIP
ncbi:MAG TPA: AsmA family protein [Flavobacterium sp.]|uniref:AsmA family protein n=1 Tax=Flavobacterium sp. TaxID=239 RepID=UPI002BE23754|nr:AsmA family protein [Flavobacterium sp.]HSD14454.1 AsmA family protein [Flavobacterium sp.]